MSVQIAASAASAAREIAKRERRPLGKRCDDDSGQAFYTIENDRCQSDNAVDGLCPPEEREACFCDWGKAIMPDFNCSACGGEGDDSVF